MNEEWSEELEECRMYKERIKCEKTIDKLNRVDKKRNAKP